MPDVEHCRHVELIVLQLRVFSVSAACNEVKNAIKINYRENCNAAACEPFQHRAVDVRNCMLRQKRRSLHGRDLRTRGHDAHSCAGHARRGCVVYRSSAALQLLLQGWKVVTVSAEKEWPVQRNGRKLLE